MNDMIKKIFVFLLALTLCWGPVVTVVCSQAQDGEPVAEAVDTEESAVVIENADETNDGDESTEPSDADTESKPEPVDKTDNGNESTEPADTDTESGSESADNGENKEQDSGYDRVNETQPDEDHEQAVEESGGNPEDLDTEPELIGGIAEQPEETEDEDIVYTEEELYDWCSDHRNSGGQVTLGGNITITETISISNGGGHIVIDTGQYGLVYDGGCIYLVGDWEIIGEGVDVPVLDVQTVIQYGYSWEAGWNEVAQVLNITATGRNGTGGIAVRVRQDDGYFARYIDYTTEGLIRSYGTGAIGLYLDEPLDAYCFQIEVEGDGSASVYAPQGANLYYCKLTAEGAGASVVSGSDEIVVDTCATSPEPQDVPVINYRIVGVSGSRLYCPVQQYGGIDNLDYYITFLLSAGDGYPLVTQAFWIDWQSDSIDTGSLGQITIQGSFALPFQGLGLEDDFPLILTVDVRDPDIPCISSLWFNKSSELGAYVYLAFWDTYEREDENVILWLSDDGGETWYDFTDSPDIEWYGSSIFYCYGEISGTIILQLEVLDKGKSNIVSIHSVDRRVYGGFGGDRDGGDRNIVYINNGTGGGDSSGDNNSSNDEISSGDNDSSNSGDFSGNDNSVGDGGGFESVDSTDGSSSAGDNTSENNHSNDDSDETDITIPATPVPLDGILIFVFAGIAEGDEAAAAEIETTAIPKEWEDGDTIAISGRRLAAMAEANPKAVTFIKNGIQISVSSAALLALGLGENQLFLVEIKKLTGSSFSVLFKADDIELSGLPFVAYIGETVFDGISPASAVCVNESGDVLPTEYDPVTGKLSVFMTGSGIFTLQAEQLSESANLLVQDNGELQKQGQWQEQEQNQEQDEQPNEASSPFNVGMIVAGICAVFLLANGFIQHKRRLTRR